MKRIFTFLVLALTVSATYADIITKTYKATNFQITTKDNFHLIKFDNMITAGLTGQPGLPYHAVSLLLPPGHEAISITFEGNNPIDIPQALRLHPVQYSRPLSDRRTSVFALDESIYQSSAVFPKILTGELSTHFMNGYSYALATFTPIQYIPATGKVTYFESVTVRIETRVTVKGMAALQNLSSSESAIAKGIKFAQNPEEIDLYPHSSRSTGQYDILIITPGNFEVQIQPLVDLYAKQGLKSKITTTEFIVSNITGSDMPEKIRNHVIHEYQQSGIEQVILGGDVEHVPYRGFYCAAQSSTLYEDYNIPADLYYSALDGSWNNNSNNLWGEPGEDDLLPEVSVGRMPFSTNQELAIMINKTSKYQTNPVEGELNNHLLAGENLYYNPDTWGSDYLELLIGMHDTNGYTTIGIPATHNIHRMYDETNPWWPEDLMDAINAGSAFISHVGHANSNYTMKLYNEDITNQNFSGVNGINHNFPIIYTHGCICGAFDENDCIAERMLSIDNFASAFVGNSRYGWFNEGQNEGPSAHIHREFMDALFTDSLNRIGSAHMESKIATAPWVNAPGQWEEGALRWCFYDCNVLGDPAMAIWTNEPIDISTVYPLAILTATPSFEVTVTNNTVPVQGLTVSLIKENTLIGTGITNQTGIATVMLDTVINNSGPAEIIVSGYNCKPTSYPTAFSGNISASNISYENRNLQVYPNPAGKYIYITINNHFAQSRIKLTDLSGKTLKEIDNPAKSSTLKIETTGILPGIYFLQYSNNLENESVKVIIH